ncbi:MAG: RagB/SusD family nutrient uptake outer membrane protein [Balneola sp.]|nr:RagB/SusD family nutrient uptake outer membrane protein [Balneola sp.]MBO6650580.1 RagB/SusD family nutrient uptake outer membrane protein [Balneola sp.]MBO6712641.1 RagB/SusD family nutrient uptake outer membrane protein [Balneola sp.]MBO6800865.1 RagB/SusD family nutrient uptake outer membrane protein [Balneola sp.]MBO6870538.1 RagB/SusD family nutrient uptake outer membrane protein [Balneola sp.]
MNIKKLYIVLVAVIITGFACKESFLNVNPQQSVADNEAIETIGDYESSVTGVYNWLSDSDYYGRYFILVPDVMSDDVKQNSQANRAKEYAEYVAFEEHFITQNMWETIYAGIGAANAIINNPRPEGIPSALDDELDQFIGEAYALRGLMYFDLVRLYGQHYCYTADASHLGVPIVLETDTFSEPERNTVSEVYAQIISDMTEGMNRMGNSPRNGNTSTLSAWSVKALLARVYLHMGDFPNARIMANDVIENGPYTLVDNAGYAAAWTNDYSSESIFEISMTETDNRGSDALGRMYIEEGYGDYLPSNELYDLIPDGDARQSWFQVDNNLANEFAPFRLVKYPSTTGDNNTIVSRLSEMYLIRAEAAAMNNDDLDAQDDVTTIRQRGLPTEPAVTETGAALMDEIRLERRIELAYEGHRLWDLMRWQENMVRDECTSTVPAACTVNYPNDRFVLPIPANEQDANPNMQPNPGY